MLDLVVTTSDVDRIVFLFQRKCHSQKLVQRVIFCNSDYEKLNSEALQNPFTGICWSNITLLVSQWYQWINKLLMMTVPIRTRHRASLPPWVSHQSAHVIKKLATATKNLPPDHPKVVRLNNECALSLCNDKSEYESRLSNSLNTRLLFKYYQQIAHSIYYALY